LRDAPRTTLSGYVLDAPDPRALAGFYQRLLGWTVTDDDETWVSLSPPGGGAKLSFQLEPLFTPPTWPATGDAQQMMAHLDIEVDDLASAGAYVEAGGAVLADFQPQDHVRVYLDPVGHPFCLWVRE
jgi:predicted enzyme related to lactoylglutathione lyase